jgi:uncharacterized protein (UPF0276 family)
MANTGINIKIEDLITKYIVEEKSIATVAKELNTSADTIHKRLKLYNINRNKSDAQKQKFKDMNRQNNIINHLNCSFIRLDENGVEKLKLNYYGK